MKKLYLLTLGLTSLFYSAQTIISFENAENYSLGDVNNQNGWEVTTNSSNGFIKNQVITNEMATSGTNSLKIDVDPAEDAAWFPMFGAAKHLETAIPYQNLTLELDVNMSQLDGSTFEFGAFGITDDEYLPVVFYSFNHLGKLEVVNSVDYDYEDGNFTWQPNKWYNLKAVISETEIKYYIDNTLVHTGANYSKTDMSGLIFVHDNFGGHAYIDNIKINGAELAVAGAAKSKAVIFPNPVKDQFKISVSPENDVQSVKIYNTAGQMVKLFGQNGSYNISHLFPGNYLLEAQLKNGETVKSKIIKK